MTKFIVNNRTDALKTDINLFFTIANCQVVLSSLVRWGIAQIINSCVCPLIDNKNELMSEREFLQLSNFFLFSALYALKGTAKAPGEDQLRLNTNMKPWFSHSRFCFLLTLFLETTLYDHQITTTSDLPSLTGVAPGQKNASSLLNIYPLTAFFEVQNSK